MFPIFMLFKMRRTLVAAGERMDNIPTLVLMLRLLHTLLMLPSPLYNGSRIYNWASARVLPGGI